jgi:uncharacterized OB-fold protein
VSATRSVPVQPGLFEEDGGAVVLLGARCRSCGRPQFPRSATCPYCSSVDVEPVRLAADGTLWGWTTVHTAPPGYEGPVPFGFGVVELSAGLRVITRLEIRDGEALTFGQPMRAELVALHVDDGGDTVVTYSFAPTP